MLKYCQIALILLLLYSCKSQEMRNSYNTKAIEFNNQAVELMMAGNYDSALIVFDKAIKLDESYYLPHSSKSNIYVLRKEFHNALIESELVIKKQPDLAEGWVYSGMLYDRKGESKTANKYYQKSIEIFTKRISNPEKQHMISTNRLNRAYSYILLGETEKGKKELQSLKEEEPENFMIDQLLNTSKEDYINQLFGED